MQPRRCQQDGVVAALLEFSQPGIDVAPDVLNLHVRAQVAHLSGAPQRAGADGCAFRQLRQGHAHEHVSRVGAFRDAVDSQARVELRRQVLQTVHRQVDGTCDQGLFNFLREDSFQAGFRADLGQSNIGDLIARSLDDLDSSGDVAVFEPFLDPVGLPKGELGAPGSYRDGLHFFRLKARLTNSTKCRPSG